MKTKTINISRNGRGLKKLEELLLKGQGVLAKLPKGEDALEMAAEELEAFLSDYIPISVNVNRDFEVEVAIQRSLIGALAGIAIAYFSGGTYLVFTIAGAVIGASTELFTFEIYPVEFEDGSQGLEILPA